MNKIFCFPILFLALAACKPATEAKIGGSTSASTTPVTTPPTATTTSPLKLNIYAVYNNTNWEVPFTFNGTTATECTATTAAPTPTCTVAIPEGRLYYSDLHLQYSWYSSECKLMTFQPYYYQAANAQSADLSWAGAELIDCTTATTDKNCYGGAAPDLVSGFPDYRSLIYLPDESVGSAALSEDSVLRSGHSRTYGSNRAVANDMTGNKAASITAVGFGARDAYLANTFVDYKFSCRDDWYDAVTYEINLTITDEDTDGTPTNPALDHIKSWKGF